jgi:hypothetical protein
VTGGVADREKDRHVPLAGGLEGLLVPGLPVDGVVGVLAQIGTLLLVEAVALRGVGVGAHTSRSGGRTVKPGELGDGTQDLRRYHAGLRL